MMEHEENITIFELYEDDGQSMSPLQVSRRAELFAPILALAWPASYLVMFWMVSGLNWHTGWKCASVLFGGAVLLLMSMNLFSYFMFLRVQRVFHDPATYIVLSGLVGLLLLGPLHFWYFEQNESAWIKSWLAPEAWMAFWYMCCGTLGVMCGMLGYIYLWKPYRLRLKKNSGDLR